MCFSLVGTVYYNIKQFYGNYCEVKSLVAWSISQKAEFVLGKRYMSQTMHWC